MPSTRYLYLIRLGAGPRYKLGYSAHPQRRLAQLQTACSEPLHLLFTVACQKASVLETRAHRELSAHQVRGEWYELSDEELPAICTRLAQAAQQLNAVAAHEQRSLD